MKDNVHKFEPAVGGSPAAIAAAWWKYRYYGNLLWVLGHHIPPLEDRLREYDRRRAVYVASR